MQILDGMSPHVWQRPTAAEDWYADALAEGEHLGVTGYCIGLAEPRHVDVSGYHAYVVVPATFDYNRQGKQVNQTGAFFTAALFPAVLVCPQHYAQTDLLDAGLQ